MHEIWKPVLGYDGRYMVSNLGNVMSVGRIDSLNRSHPSTLLSPSDSGAYLHVNLCKDGISKTFCVHRLVAAAFIVNPFEFPCVNHMDENKFNNRADNLEWCSHEYNNNYGTSNYRQARAKGRKVAQYNLDGEFVADYFSISEASRRTAFSQGAIYNGLATGRATNGYFWRDTKEVKIYA